MAGFGRFARAGKAHILLDRAIHGSSTRNCLDGLERVGFKLDFSATKETAWQFQNISPAAAAIYFQTSAAPIIVASRRESGLKTVCRYRLPSTPRRACG